MKTAIICFSQTGNTRNIAEQIRSGIQEQAGNCDLMTLEEAQNTLLGKYDLIGLGCPVFYYKEPFNVREFMASLPYQDQRHWFVFCTHAAVMGQTLYAMTQCLEEKGAVVIGSHHTYADITVPYYPKHTLASGHPDDRDLQEAFNFGKKVAACSNAVSNGDIHCIRKPSPSPVKWAGDEAKRLTRKFLSQVMPPLSINSGSCIRCGQCADECPVGGIDIDADPIRIQEPCVYCLHCVSICPTCALEADWQPLVNMAPANYARYRQALNDAQRRGEFRWLVDPDTVDCTYPLYRQREDEIK